MNRQELEAAIYALIDLLNKPSTKEDDFQKLFEKHPQCLHALGYSDSIAHPELIDQATGEKYIPDFICRRRSDGLAEIVDLKRPSMDLGLVDKNGRRAKLNAGFEHCVSQVEDYIEFYQSNENKLWYEENFWRTTSPRRPWKRPMASTSSMSPAGLTIWWRQSSRQEGESFAMLRKLESSCLSSIGRCCRGIWI